MLCFNIPHKHEQPWEKFTLSKLTAEECSYYDPCIGEEDSGWCLSVIYITIPISFSHKARNFSYPVRKWKHIHSTFSHKDFYGSRNLTVLSSRITEKKEHDLTMGYLRSYTDIPRAQRWSWEYFFHDQGRRKMRKMIEEDKENFK